MPNPIPWATALMSNCVVNKCAVYQMERRLGNHSHQNVTNTQKSLASLYAGAEAAAPPTRQPTIQINLLASEEAALSTVSKVLHLSQQPEEIQQSPTNKSPLYLIHDGSGICTHYRRLRPQGRRVFALHDPKFLIQAGDQRSWGSLIEMATAYADTISSERNNAALGDCILGGWSFGGVVAFEAARILMGRGQRVKGVVLIDSPPPVGHVPLSDAIIEAVTAQPVERDAAAKAAAKAVSPVASAIRKLVQQSFRICAGLIGNFSDSVGTCPQKLSTSATSAPRVVLLRSAAGWTPPQDFASSVGEMENPWLQDRRDQSLATAGWEMLTGAPIQCVDIPGNHFQVFDAPNITAVSAALVDVCSDLDSN